MAGASWVGSNKVQSVQTTDRHHEGVPSPPASRIGTTVLGLIFLATTAVLGALLGGAYVRFLMPRAVDGWAGIAQALGGLMTGGLIAIVIAAFLVVPLARRGTRALAVAALVVTCGAALIALVLYLARPERTSQGAAGNERGSPPLLSKTAPA